MPPAVAAGLVALAATALSVVPLAPPRGLEDAAASRAVEVREGMATSEIGVLRLTPSLLYSFDEEPDRRRIASVALRIEPGPRYRRFRPPAGPRWTRWQGRRVEEEASPDRTAVRLEAIEIALGDRRLRRLEVDRDGGPAQVERVIEVPNVSVDVPDWTALRVLYHLRFLDETRLLLREFDGGDPRRTFVWEPSPNRMALAPYRPAAPPHRPIWAVREAFIEPADAAPGAEALLVVVVANDGDETGAESPLSVRFGAAAVEGRILPLGPAATCEVRVALPAPSVDEAVEIATPSGVHWWRRPRRPRLRIVSVAPAGVVRSGETVPVLVEIAEEGEAGATGLRLAASWRGAEAETVVDVPAGGRLVAPLDLPPRDAGRHLLDVRLGRGRISYAAGRFPVDVLPPARPIPRVSILSLDSAGHHGPRLRAEAANAGDAPGRIEVVTVVAAAPAGAGRAETFVTAALALDPGETRALLVDLPPVPGGWTVSLEATATDPDGRARGRSDARREVYLPYPPLPVAVDGETLALGTAADGHAARGVVWRFAGETGAVAVRHDLAAIPSREAEAEVMWIGRVAAAGAAAGGAAVLEVRAGEAVRRVKIEAGAETTVCVRLPFAPVVEARLEGAEEGLRVLGSPAPAVRVPLRDLDLASIEGVVWETGVGRIGASFAVAGRSSLRPRRPVGVRLEIDGGVAAETRARPGARVRLSAPAAPGLRRVRVALARPLDGVGDSEASAVLYVPGPGRPRWTWAVRPARLGDGAAAVLSLDGGDAFDAVVEAGGATGRLHAVAGEEILVTGGVEGPWAVRRADGLVEAVAAVTGETEATWRIASWEILPDRFRWAVENLGPARPAPGVWIARIESGGLPGVARVVGRAAEGPTVPAAGVLWRALERPAGAAGTHLLLLSDGATTVLARSEGSAAHPASARPPVAPILASAEAHPPAEGWVAAASLLARVAAAAPALGAAAEAARDLAAHVDDGTPGGRLGARAAADRLGAAAEALAKADLAWPATAEADSPAAFAEAAAALASAAAPPVLDRPALRAFLERFAEAARPLAEAPRP